MTAIRGPYGGEIKRSCKCGLKSRMRLQRLQSASDPEPIPSIGSQNATNVQYLNRLPMVEEETPQRNSGHRGSSGPRTPRQREFHGISCTTPFGDDGAHKPARNDVPPLHAPPRHHCGREGRDPPGTSPRRDALHHRVRRRGRRHDGQHPRLRQSGRMGRGARPTSGGRRDRRRPGGRVRLRAHQLDVAHDAACQRRRCFAGAPRPRQMADHPAAAELRPGPRPPVCALVQAQQQRPFAASDARLLGGLGATAGRYCCRGHAWDSSGESGESGAVPSTILHSAEYLRAPDLHARASETLSRLLLATGDPRVARALQVLFSGLERGLAAHGSNDDGHPALLARDYHAATTPAAALPLLHALRGALPACGLRALEEINDARRAALLFAASGGSDCGGGAPRRQAQSRVCVSARVAGPAGTRRGARGRRRSGVPAGERRRGG